MVIGSLTATVLLVSSQVKGPDQEGVFDALVNAAIYTKFCDGALSPNTQKILGRYTAVLRCAMAHPLLPGFAMKRHFWRRTTRYRDLRFVRVPRP